MPILVAPTIHPQLILAPLAYLVAYVISVRSYLRQLRPATERVRREFGRMNATCLSPSVDPFTEAQIQEAMDLILECSTSTLIAHRLSTVRSVDRIVVLERGRIIEEGNHQALMTHRGHYAELYDTYFRHQSLDYVQQVGERRMS